MGQVLALAELPLGGVELGCAEGALQDSGERRTFGVYGVPRPTCPSAPAVVAAKPVASWIEKLVARRNDYEVDFVGARGQDLARRAPVVAAPGRQNALMMETISPGSRMMERGVKRSEEGSIRKQLQERASSSPPSAVGSTR